MSTRVPLTVVVETLIRRAASAAFTSLALLPSTVKVTMPQRSLPRRMPRTSERILPMWTGSSRLHMTSNKRVIAAALAANLLLPLTVFAAAEGVRESPTREIGRAHV